MRASSASRYSNTLATVVWTAGWIAAAGAAVLRLVGSFDGWASLAVAVSVTLAAWGCLRAYSTAAAERVAVPTEDTAAAGPWHRRVLGWLAALVWCGAAVAWNVGITVTLIRLAGDGRGGMVLFLVPWSLIGLFLLRVLFASVTVAVASATGAVLKLTR